MKPVWNSEMKYLSLNNFKIRQGRKVLIFFPVIMELMALDFQLLVLGSGEDKTEEFFRELASAFPQK